MDGPLLPSCHSRGVHAVIRLPYPVKAPLWDGGGLGPGLSCVSAAVQLHYPQQRHPVRCRRNTPGLLNAAALAAFRGLRRVPEEYRVEFEADEYIRSAELHAYRGWYWLHAFSIDGIVLSAALAHNYLPALGQACRRDVDHGQCLRGALEAEQAQAMG